MRSTIGGGAALSHYAILVFAAPGGILPLPGPPVRGRERCGRCAGRWDAWRGCVYRESLAHRASRISFATPIETTSRTR